MKGYREKHGLFICSGFLFNHESPRRGEHFVTRKITISLAKIKLGLQTSFELGNLDAQRDWGFAEDYVEAMWLMLQQNTPDDYVISTGENHSVRDFLDAAFREIGITDWIPYVQADPAMIRPAELLELCGKSDKAKKTLRWSPHVHFTAPP